MERYLGASDKRPVAGIAVDDSLVAATHQFEFGGFSVRIELPSHAFLPPRLREVGRQVRGLDRCGLAAWDPVGLRPANARQGEVTSFAPRYVIVTALRRLPEDPFAIEWDQKAYEAIGDRPGIRELQGAFASALDDAFEYWLGVIRWHTGNGFIGRQSRPHSYEPPLFDAETGEVLAVGHVTLSDGIMQVMRLEDWESAQRSLAAGERPPLAPQYYFSGVLEMQLGDIGRAVVDLAIAAEVHMKREVTSALPGGLHPSIRAAVRRLSTTEYCEKLFPKHLSTAVRARYAAIKSTLARLAHDRNEVVHSGKVPTSEEQCRSYAEAVGELLNLHVKL
jgi:hypothetical protein